MQPGYGICGPPISLSNPSCLISLQGRCTIPSPLVVCATALSCFRGLCFCLPSSNSLCSCLMVRLISLRIPLSYIICCLFVLVREVPPLLQVLTLSWRRLIVLLVANVPLPEGSLGLYICSKRIAWVPAKKQGYIPLGRLDCEANTMAHMIAQGQSGRSNHAFLQSGIKKFWSSVCSRPLRIVGWHGKCCGMSF